MQFLRNVWSTMKWVVAAFLIAEPWLFGGARSYNVYQDEWVQYAGGAFFALYLIASGTYSFLSTRVRRTAALQWPFVFLMGVPFLLGILLYFLGKPLYTHARFALERPALEAYLHDGACPQQQCFSEAGVTAFVWAANNRTWFGVCHDTEGAMRRAIRLRNDDRRAGRRAQARVFGAVATRADRLADDWYTCAASKAPLGVPLTE